MELMLALSFAILAAILQVGQSHPSDGAISDVSKCPDPRYCVCDRRHVECSHLRHWDWKRLLQSIPSSINKLTVKWSKVQFPQEPLPSNYTFPYLHEITLFGVQSRSPGVVLNEAILKPFPNLMSLNFSYSHVFQLDSNALTHTPLLERLILTGNNIRQFSSDCFQNLTRLHTFHASFDEGLVMNSLPKNLFAPLISLTEVDLSGGYLKYIHPNTFQNNSKLKVIKLNNNKLATLQQGTLDNLPDLTEIHIYDNPLECSCELHWLVDELQSRKAYIYQDIDLINCVKNHSPFHRLYNVKSDNYTNPNLTELLSEYAETRDLRIAEVYRLTNVSKQDIPCVSPKIHLWESDPKVNVSILRTTHHLHGCIAEGVPRPFVYWVTPVGLLASVDNYGWHDPEHFYEEFNSLHRLIVPPTYRKTHIEVFYNNSISFWNMRPYFAGEYTCVAVNPAGNFTRSFKVHVKTMVKTYMIHSVIVGGFIAGTFWIIAVIFGLIKYLTFRHCTRFKVQPEDDFDPSDIEAIAREYPDYFEVFCTVDGLTPYLTPRKCATPCEAEDAERNRVEHRARILEQLSEVRERLHNGMLRHVGRIRSYSQHMRESSSSTMHSLRYSSSRYMHNFRDTSNQYMQKIRYNTGNYMHSIRSNSSTYAERMRVGVVMATEQVKSGVQSMKEFCGTGDISQTLSTVSCQTNVDSQEVCRVVMKQTYV